MYAYMTTMLCVYASLSNFEPSDQFSRNFIWTLNTIQRRVNFLILISYSP
jgi:hypothetical protein